MKKFLLFIFTFSFLFAIKDYMIKPNYKFFYKAFITSSFYPLELNQNIKSDKYNVFMYKGHFRVIFGKEYDTFQTRKFANQILDIANYVWKKEVEEFEFKAPRNSDKYYIDIYIANSNAYNPELGIVNISYYYAGYSAAYNNGTPYFVINPDIDLDILKVTIAHEFFHTIQYAYGFDKVNYNIWHKNTWFLEATAVMMEDEVYDNVNDYINYLKDYLDNTNYPIDYSDGEIEYGKVLFAKYIKEKYGIEKIRKIFEDYEINESILDDLRKEFNFDNLMLGYAKCLANEKECFKDGRLFPKVRFVSQQDYDNIYYYGIGFIDDGAKNYLCSSNKEYLQEDFKGNLNKIIDINKNGLILINRQKEAIPVNFSKNNNYQNFELKKGWNLVGNIFDEDLNVSKIYGIIIWVYRDRKYEAYSNIDDLQKAIKDNNFAMKKNCIFENEGFWVYSDKDINLSIDNYNLTDNNIPLKYGWQIITFSSAFSPKYLDAKIIWGYDNNWSYYGDVDLNISKIDYIKPIKGYFVKWY